MAKLTDEEFGAKLVAAYRTYRDLHEAGALDSDAEHPRDTVNNWISTIRDCKARDGNAGLGPVTIQKRNAKDDVQPVKSANGNSGAGGATPAMDGTFTTDDKSNPLFICSDGKIFKGDAALAARAAQINPTRVRRMAAAIAGYDRIP